MVTLSLYTNNLKVKYKSALFSEATFVVVFAEITSIILPFIFGYYSNGFWLKRDVFYEQPNIKFKGEYFLMATTNNMNNPISCSTRSTFYPELFQFLDTCSVVKIRELDNNFDEKIDELIIHFKINLQDNMTLTSINIIIPIDYKLQTYCHLQMQSAIVYQQFLLPSISDYSIAADLIVSQSNPLYCHKKIKHNSYNYTTITNEEEINTYTINNFIKDYSRRNISTHLSNIYTSFVLDKKNSFNLNLIIRYPEHKIYYKPGFWQIIKWAWIQYFAIYIIVTKINDYIKNYIFTNRLVLFYKELPSKKNE